jgi:hypothetical protein
MTGRIYHPEDKHPEPYQSDLAPDAGKGLNWGQAGAEMPSKTAFEVKEMHELLSELSSDELKEVRVLCEGARLETGATYLEIIGGTRQVIQAEGAEDVEPGDVYLPKKDMPYQIWNRLVKKPR